jgi:hypothetical protein
MEQLSLQKLLIILNLVSRLFNSLRAGFAQPRLTRLGILPKPWKGHYRNHRGGRRRFFRARECEAKIRARKREEKRARKKAKVPSAKEKKRGRGKSKGLE